MQEVDVKQTHDVDEETPAESEYLTTPMDYYVRGELMSRPLARDDSEYYFGGRP